MAARWLGCWLVILPLILGHISSAACSSDPVDLFISRADSLHGRGDEEALSDFVAENRILVGAVVGRLGEVALQLRADGLLDAARQNLDFAKLLAEIHRDLTGSAALDKLIETYRTWTADQDSTWREAKSLEHAATEARNAGDFDRAIELLTDAMARYESIGDSRSSAIVWGSLGVVCWYQGDFEAVLSNYESALAARRAIEDRILEGKTLNGLGSVNFQLGRFDLALDYYRQAIDLRRRTGDGGGLATSLNYIGNVYLSLGRVFEARTSLEEALPAVEATGDSVKQYELLISIAGLNADMSRLSDSNRTLREALALARKMDDPRRQALCHNNLAFNLTEAFRYGEALCELEEAKALLERQPDPEQNVVYHLNSGIANMKIGELDWAESDFDTLLHLSEIHKMPAFQLEALLNRGYLAKERRQLEDGLWYARDGLELAEEMANPRMIRKALILIAELQHESGQYDQAIGTWERLLARDKEGGLEADLALDRMGLANNLAMAGRTEEAIRVFREVAPAVKATQQGDLILALAFGIGHSFEKANRDSARFYYDRALSLLDEVRKDVGGTEVRTGFLGGMRRFYFEEVARYYASLAHGRDVSVWSGLAFRTIERAKARGLLDLIEASVLATGSADEEALLDSLYRLAPEEPGYGPHKRDLEEEYDRIRSERLEALGQDRMAGIAIAGPEEIQGFLSPETVMLAYALGDSTSLLWAIDPRGFEVYRLPGRAAIEAQVGVLREAIAEPVIGDAMLRQTARGLYLALVAPAEQRLKDALRLVVAPDGVLFELPFEVLLTEGPIGDPHWGEMPYLARRYEVVYAPSASIYSALRRGRHDSSYDMELLALGDPDYNLIDPLPGSRADLHPLPQSRKEILSIASHIDDRQRQVFTGAGANEAVLKSHLKKRSARVLHLAAHGIVDPAEPIASAIALCPDAEGQEDGYLRTLEIISLPMEIDLVVLSACESARGRIGRGEGVIGLSRAFLASGSRGVIASLWAVSDESTAALMEKFYAQMLGQSRPAGAAMRSARLALIDDPRFSHPYYWSSFVVVAPEDAPW